MERQKDQAAAPGKTPAAENKMGVMPVPKLVFNMAIPLMFSLLIQSLYNIVDSIFVARIGIDALAATSLAYPVQILMIALAVGTGVGANALLSRMLGAKQHDRIRQAAATGILLAVLSSLIFVIVGIFGAPAIARAMASEEDTAVMCGTYLRICMAFCTGTFLETMAQRFLQASGKTLLSMVSLVAGAVTNIILDPIMIFGLLGFPKLGIAGAAIATVIGQWIGAAVALLLNQFVNPEIRVSFKGFHLDMESVKSIYKVGLPTIVMQAMGSIMNFGMNALLIQTSETAVAFFGVYYKLQNFLFMPINGLGQASIPIVGYNFGAKNLDRIKKTLRTTLPTAIIIGLAATVIFMAIPRQLLSLFSSDPEMLSIGVPALRIICVTFALASVTTILGFSASGLGNGVINMVGTGLRQVIVLIPVAALILHIAGISYVWFAMWLSEGCAVVYAIFAMKRQMRKTEAVIKR